MYKYLKLNVYIGTVLICLFNRCGTVKLDCVEFPVHLLQNDSNDKLI